jgi:DNA repair protein RadA/Sms
MKSKVHYVCQACGYETPKWMGKCPQCGQWDTLVEELVQPTTTHSLKGKKMTEPVPLSRIEGEKERRILTGIGEFDRVLGGGIMPASVVLVGGEPGIGKSTLFLQILNQLSTQGRRVLYVSGEESPNQIRLRAQRLHAISDDLFVVFETMYEIIENTIKELEPEIVVIDSIQTMHLGELPSAPGSVGQIRETGGRFARIAKTLGIPIFLIGHVTKEGAIAGPKILEHLVDAVLYFESPKDQPFRVLRGIKNRYGPTNEIAVFEMTGAGIKEVTNPSELFMGQRSQETPGSVVVPCLEGSRPLLVEIQALVTPTNFGVPRRTAIGLDPNRLALLVAVLEKKMGMPLGEQDIFVNAAGGLKIVETAVDLGIVSAIASSFYEKAIPFEMVVFGEIGLAGEVRGVMQGDVRVQEAVRMGFTACVCPEKYQPHVSSSERFDLIKVGEVKDALKKILDLRR